MTSIELRHLVSPADCRCVEELVTFAALVGLSVLGMASIVMGVRDTFVKVQEAATILGVAPNTVRKWGATGKIPEYRHPANGYRLYKRQELEKFLLQIESSRRLVQKNDR